jgi:hypothetical protein
MGVVLECSKFDVILQDMPCEHFFEGDEGWFCLLSVMFSTESDELLEISNASVRIFLDKHTQS